MLLNWSDVASVYIGKTHYAKRGTELSLKTDIAQSERDGSTQTETQNSNLTFEKDECAKEYEELGLKELKELIEADRKTENSSEKPNNSTISKMEQVDKDINVRSKDEPQTERSSE